MAPILIREFVCNGNLCTQLLLTACLTLPSGRARQSRGKIILWVEVE